MINWLINTLSNIVETLILRPLYSPQKFIPEAPFGLPVWALITGASDGIGREFALQLATNGYNIILVGKDLNKLVEVQNNIKTQTRIIVIDFTKDSLDIIFDFLKAFNKDVQIVINSAGISYPRPSPFNGVNDFNLYQDIISCNIKPIVHLTHFFLTKKDPVYIFNISSALAILPSPFLSVYGASKSFVTKFSNDVNLELINDKKQKSRVYALNPCMVSTKMSKIKESIACPNPETYVTKIINFGVFIPHEIILLVTKIPYFGIKIFETLLINTFLRSLT